MPAASAPRSLRSCSRSTSLRRAAASRPLMRSSPSRSRGSWWITSPSRSRGTCSATKRIGARTAGSIRRLASRNRCSMCHSSCWAGRGSHYRSVDRTRRRDREGGGGARQYCGHGGRRLGLFPLRTANHWLDAHGRRLRARNRIRDAVVAVQQVWLQRSRYLCCSSLWRCTARGARRDQIGQLDARTPSTRRGLAGGSGWGC